MFYKLYSDLKRTYYICVAYNSASFLLKVYYMFPYLKKIIKKVLIKIFHFNRKYLTLKMSSKFIEIFKTSKMAVIAMVHVNALPGKFKCKF